MAQYTIEDVEILRQKSGISYEEAVNLLEYHNGSLARALVDLEKNGRLKSGPATEKHKGFKGLLNTLFRLRLVVKRGEHTIANLSVLFLALAVLLSVHMVVISIALALVLGYRITFERNSRAFADATVDDLFKNAKTNVQSSVQSFARQFTKNEEKSDPVQPSAPRTESAPSGTRPVNATFSDSGAVNVHDKGDGYHEADIQ